MAYDILIVDGSTSGLVHTNKASVLRLEVQGRNPIIRHIGGDSARRALGSSSLSVVHREAETTPSHDGVHMARDLARTNDGIGAFHDNRNFAR